jgi:hypothetical protein
VGDTSCSRGSARLRARLLEFLKFRVLAAQGDFFRDFESAADRAPDPARLRLWLGPLWPEALELDDQALLETFATARRLYTD